MKRTCNICLYLGFFIVFSFFISSCRYLDVSNNEETEKRADRRIIKVKVKDKEEVNKLADLVAIWEVRQDHIITDTTDEIIEEMKKMGFKVEILYNSVEDYIRSMELRNK